MVEEVLIQICPDFLKIKQNIDESTFNGDFKIVKGYVQSKKSWAIITIAIYSAFKHGKIPTIVVRNSIDDFIQIKSRLLNVISQLPLKITITRGRSFQLVENEVVINICMRNSTDLRKFNETIKNEDKSRFVSIIDEVDSNENDGGTMSQGDIVQFIEHSGMIWGVSATPLSNLARFKIDKKDILTLSKPMWYKDISTFTFIDIPSSSKCTRFSEDCLLSQDPNIENYISYFSKKELETCTIWNEKHPRISLIRTGTVIAPQLSFAKKINEKYPNLTIVTYNGIQEGITLRGKGIDIESVITLLNGKSSTLFDNVHRFKGIHISDVIELLESFGVEMCSHIIIIAGKKADRGISFVSSSFGNTDQKLKWHLTEMYLTTSESTTQNNILQISGRLCGVFHDTISLTVITNIGNDIMKAYYSQDELIQRLEDDIQNVPISKDKIVKRKFSSNFTCKLKQVDDDLLEGGWDWANEGKIYTSQEAQFEIDMKIPAPLTQEEILFNREVKKALIKKINMNEDEFKRLTTKMFSRWSSSQTCIGNFMRSINPRKIYTSNEMNELCVKSGIRLSDCHSTTDKKRVKYGNFIVKSDNSNFQLHPDLVCHYEKYFGCE